MNVILSTRNPGKALQIKAMFTDTPIRILTLDEAGIRGKGDEDGDTLEDNGLKKAMYAFNRLDEPNWIMADDTGFFIEALGGEPGVQAAVWAGEDAKTEEITEFTLKKLNGHTNRRAKFRTVIVLVSPHGTPSFHYGEVGGHILETARGPFQPNLPYGPIFVPDGSNMVWSEMTTEEENTISQRGIAIRKAREYLLKELKSA